MEILLAIGIGALWAIGVYLLMRRSVVKLLLGLAILSNAANLLIFTSAGLVRGREPVIVEGQTGFDGPVGDPLAQALILTAIVISFGVLAFAIVLVKRTYRERGTDDLDALGTGEPDQ